MRLLEMMLNTVIEMSGIEVDDALCCDLKATIFTYSDQVNAQHLPGSFQSIFWKQQQKASELKKAKSLKWGTIND